MVLTEDGEAYHPYNVPAACPPEPQQSLSTKEGYPLWQEFYAKGLRPGRPGDEHWEPIPDGAWRVSGTDEKRGEPFYLGQIITIDEAREDGRDPRVSEDGVHLFGYHFSAHRIQTTDSPGST